MIATHEIRTMIFPKRVLQEEGTENSFLLLKERDLALALRPEPTFLLKKKGYVLLDFGDEYAGGIRLLIQGHGQASDNRNRCKLRIRFGESAGEACVDVGEKNATEDHSPRDFVIEPPGLCDQTFGGSGFRFCRIDNVGDVDVYFAAIVLSYAHIDAPKIGYFHSSDEKLNRIFDVACRTAALCCQNGFLYDGIKRDRLVWCGDMGVEVRTLLETYGDIDSVIRTLDFCREHYPLPCWMNNMPTYSLWWIVNIAFVYRHNGDLAWLRSNGEYLGGLLKILDACVDSRGEVDFTKDKSVETSMPYFLDWPSSPDPEQKSSAVALLHLALEDSVSVLDALGEDPSLPKAILARLKFLPMRHDAAKGLLGVKGLADPNQDISGIEEGGPDGLATFSILFPMLALSKRDKTEEALSLLEEYYGAMLDKGATTFFEDFEYSWREADPIDVLPREGHPYLAGDYGQYCYPGYRLSLCHGWASGPVPFLLEEIAGFHFLDSTHIEIRPNLCHLSSLSAAIWTKYGLLSMSVEEGRLHVKAPQGIEVITD